MLGAWPVPLAGCILRTAAVCCVVREVWPNGPVACFAYGRGLLCGAYSGCGWGWWRGMFRVSASGFPVCYEVDNSPLFNFNRIFPPFSRSVPKPCAETSYLRVQCLWGRADVWSARAVGTTILDVFGYGLPTESGVGSQWRYCYCRGREVGNTSEKDMGSLGKFAFIPPFPLKI